MAATRRETEAQPKPPPKEARCKVCGEWISTVPAGTTWVRGRCGNRRCKAYGEGQTVHLREG